VPAFAGRSLSLERVAHMTLDGPDARYCDEELRPSCMILEMIVAS
jgi:hypothetical protein